MNDTVKLVVLHIVLENPGIYLREIRSKVLYLTGSDLSLSTICQLLSEQRFSRKKMRFVARQRNDFTRAIYAAEVALYDPGMFVFLDETGSDRRNVLRKYGYSFRGIPAVSHKLLVRGQDLSTMACTSIHGLLDFETVEFSVDGNTFYQFVCKKVLPLLLPFDGVNHHSIVVMDNASVHHVDGISDLISTAGSLLIYLPPYSHDYNPIEEAFSKVKTLLKQYEGELELGNTCLENLLLLAFSQITSDNCYNWIDHCEIYT